MTFDTLFANPAGRTARGPFLGALAVLLLAVVFYYLEVKGRNGEWVLATLLFPALMLHARRLHDMGLTAWLLLVPGGLMVLAFAIWLKLVSLGAQLDGLEPKAALVVAALFILWAAVAKGQAGANRYGEA